MPTVCAVLKVLDDSGLRFGVEYVGPKTLWASERYPFIHTLAEMRELFAEMNRPNVGLVLDSWHCYHAGDTAADILSLRARGIVSVDLNDAPAGVPKDQMVDGKRELPASTGVIDVERSWARWRRSALKVRFAPSRSTRRCAGWRPTTPRPPPWLH